MRPSDVDSPVLFPVAIKLDLNICNWSMVGVHADEHLDLLHRPN